MLFASIRCLSDNCTTSCIRKAGTTATHRSSSLPRPVTATRTTHFSSEDPNYSKIIFRANKYHKNINTIQNSEIGAESLAQFNCSESVVPIPVGSSSIAFIELKELEAVAFYGGLTSLQFSVEPVVSLKYSP